MSRVYKLVQRIEKFLGKHRISSDNYHRNDKSLKRTHVTGRLHNACATMTWKREYLEMVDKIIVVMAAISFFIPLILLIYVLYDISNSDTSNSKTFSNPSDDL